MFDFFRKKRISQYLLSVSNYVSSNFKPEPPSDKEEGVKYSHRNVRYSLSEAPQKPAEEDTQQPEVQYSISTPPKKTKSGDRFSGHDADIKYSDRDTVRYSDRYSVDDDIPNLGDRFAASSVRTFLSQNTGSPSLSRMASKLDSYLDLTFVDILTRSINAKGWRDSRVYKAAQMDRRLFSKIMSDRNYKPSKDTALALVIALELSLKQANDLLSRAGYTLSHSSKRDVIIEYFIRERIYNLSDINEVLYHLDQKIIGR